MFGGPHPDTWGPEGGLFTLFYRRVTKTACDSGLRLVQTKEVGIEADLWGCLLCLAA